MTSQKQIEANRRNAQKSTGPRTDAGKAVTRYNSITHGFRAKGLDLLPNEDPEEYRARLDSFMAEHQPTTEVEHRLVNQAVTLSWKLDRADRYESATLARRHRETIAEAKQIIWDRRNRQNRLSHENPYIPCDEFTEAELIEIADAADQALFDPGTEAERFRRYRNSLKREFDKTLSAIAKFPRHEVKPHRECPQLAESGASEPIWGAERPESKSFTGNANIAGPGAPRRTEIPTPTAEISASEPILKSAEDLETAKPEAPGQTEDAPHSKISASEPILESVTPTAPLQTSPVKLSRKQKKRLMRRRGAA
jgi:hypothetical protein